MVIVAAGCVLLLMGVFGKIGAAFATIPTPVIGGMFLVMFGVITAVGISNLQVRPGILRKAAALHLLPGARRDGDSGVGQGSRGRDSSVPESALAPNGRKK